MKQFGKENEVHIEVGGKAVADYYNSKKCHYINVGTHGFYLLGTSDPLELNKKLASGGLTKIPDFSTFAKCKIRVRCQYKGSGDYGVFGIGLYNGQTANKPELNKEPHFVARLSYPFQIGNQIIEPSVQGYFGKYVMPNDLLSEGVKTNHGVNYLGQRAAVSFILYPRPFGIQAEYNIGQGPEFNNTTDSIDTQNLTGGYITLNYMARIGKHFIFPFVRAQYYDGGKKHEKDARSYTVHEYEVGVEWQPFKNFEFVAMYTMSDRRFEDFSKQNNKQSGNLLRLQAQVNF